MPAGATKYKGKKRAVSKSEASSSTASSSIVEDTIIIDDSDEDGNGCRVTRPRKSGHPSRQKRKRTTTSIEMNLTDDQDEDQEEVGRHASSGKRSTGPARGSSRRDAKRTRLSRDSAVVGEVIVIDD
jgi:hypothetical protein